MLECGWQHEADVVYVSSVCFPKELTDAITEQARNLKEGARIVTLKAFDGEVSDFLRIVYCLKVLMTWGTQSVVIYERIGPRQIDKENKLLSAQKCNEKSTESPDSSKEVRTDATNTPVRDKSPMAVKQSKRL